MPIRHNLLIEVSGALLLVAAVVAVGFWSAREHREALIEQRASCERQVQAVQAQESARAEALADSQAEAAFRAYASGIHFAVLANRTDALLLSVSELLRLSSVAFVHLLAPDGKVIASSNQKFTETGRAGDRATWALGVKDFTTRAGDLPGTIELAMPIKDAAGAKAVLWMGYNTELVKKRAHPAAAH